MSDGAGFEERVGAALADGADGAPAVGGLAARARGRARVRRRRTAGAVVVAAVLAVVAVSVPVAVLHGGDAPEDVATVEDGWKTVELTAEAVAPANVERRVLVDVPESWVETTGCAYAVGVSAQRCVSSEGVNLILKRQQLSSLLSGPGLGDGESGWSGYVDVGRDAAAEINVTSDDRETALRVLGSVRPSGTDFEPPTSWDQADFGPISYPVPSPSSGVKIEESRVRSGRADSLAVELASELDDGRWQAIVTRAGFRIQITAPTLALAQLIAGSTQRADSVPPTSGWQTVEHDGVLVDVPTDWAQVDEAACGVVGRPRYGPTAAGPCAKTRSVNFADEGLYDPFAPPGLRTDDSGTWSGYVFAGDQAVTVDGLDLDTARRVLGSARAGDGPVVNVAQPWEERESGGVTWSQPPGSDVQVAVDSAITSCAGDGPTYPAARQETGRWRAAYCANRSVLVYAPTQALADLVASTLESRTRQDTWQDVSTAGVELEIPSDYMSLDISGCSESVVDSQGARFGPEGTDPCARSVPVDVLGRDSPPLAATTLRRPGFAGGVGVVFSGDEVVRSDADLETKRRILASVHVDGEDPGDLSQEWVERDSGGVAWSQPPASDVEVRLLSGYPSCTAGVADPSPAERLDDGRWRAFSCQARGATITAPTQALADLVASTVEP